MLQSQLENIFGSLALLLPELWLAGTFLLLVFLDVVRSEKLTRLLPYVLIAALLLNFVFISPEAQGMLFLNALHLDGFAVFFKYFFTLAGIITVVISIKSRLTFDQEPTAQAKGAGEYYSLLVAMLLGAHLLAMANHLLMIYLSMEMLSITGYILVMFRFNRKSSEAGMKYVLFGAFSSAVMLYGMSLLYGFSGSLLITDVIKALPALPPALAIVALALTFAGFLFKISAAPFHLWTPDIYEGAPTPVVAFFSVVPKAAGMAVLLKIAYAASLFPATREIITVLLSVAALGSVVIGTLAALWQTDAKRLLAYSSIAHAGFMLIGAVTLSPSGMQSVLFYLVTYLFISFGVFVLIVLGENYLHTDRMSAFKGLGLVEPLFGVLLTVGMVALVGLPPTAGFTAKLLIFSALWEQWQLSGNVFLLTLLIVGLFSTVISLYFYLKLPFFLFFRVHDEHETPFKLGFFQKLIAAVIVLPVVVLFFKPDWVMGWIQIIINP